ncbi:Essential protein Yae1, N terminal [Geosmithia morbida]|uniref:Essential protein Yae1, N terminal n=1 Tax=Geosmithia morbida TaxID=1094350 RepID=A0A9P4YP18_9HYPO|nr:Essential protein Yae1, N terminal [Geosmithia morbida]KAF4119967.1 Essential protein Yae1, N terminal [Geosmithia morbida]
MTQQDDLFDDVLHVESRFYNQGYNDGLRDGGQSGLAEGRAFGLQKGFEKFLESGRLAGKSVNNARLEKNISSLYALVDPKTVSIENSDTAVQDFDDRLKKAQGKERIIDRIVGGANKAAGGSL